MSRKDEIRAHIIESLLFGDEDFIDLNDDTSLLGSGIVDSTGVVELVGFLERQFGVELQSAEIVPANLDSIGRMVAFLDRKLA